MQSKYFEIDIMSLQFEYSLYFKITQRILCAVYLHVKQKNYSIITVVEINKTYVKFGVVILVFLTVVKKFLNFKLCNK